MSDWLRLVFIFAAAVNPAAVALAAWAPSRPRTQASATAATGLVVAAAILLLATAGADGLLDFLDVQPETFRIAAGMVMLTGGAYAIARARVAAAPFEDGWRGGIAPLALPLIASPAAVVAAISYGADDGIAKAFTAALPAVALGAALTLARAGRWTAVADGAARVLGAALVAVAAGLIVEGVRDI